jgi:hypothetical protein
MVIRAEMVVEEELLDSDEPVELDPLLEERSFVQIDRGYREIVHAAAKSSHD